MRKAVSQARARTPVRSQNNQIRLMLETRSKHTVNRTEKSIYIYIFTILYVIRSLNFGANRDALLLTINIGRTLNNCIWIIQINVSIQHWNSFDKHVIILIVLNDTLHCKLAYHVNCQFERFLVVFRSEIKQKKKISNVNNDDDDVVSHLLEELVFFVFVLCVCVCTNITRSEWEKIFKVCWIMGYGTLCSCLCA